MEFVYINSALYQETSSLKDVTDLLEQTNATCEQKQLEVCC